MPSPERLPVNSGLQYLSDDAFAHYERTAAAARTREINRTPGLVEGDFDFPHLQRIHRYILQDVYPWAGSLRTEQTFAFGMPHLLVEQLPQAVPAVFNDIQNVIPPVNDAHQAAQVLAEHWSNLTMVHPFLDGNSRTQRLFFSLYLPAVTDLQLDWYSIDPDALHAARHMAFITEGDTSWMTAQLEPGIVAVDDVVSGPRLGSLAGTVGIKDDGRAVEMFTSMVEHHIDGGDGHSFQIPDVAVDDNHVHRPQLDYLEQLDREHGAHHEHETTSTVEQHHEPKIAPEHPPNLGPGEPPHHHRL